VSTQLVECVANFSEGRRPDVVGALTEAIAQVSGVLFLDQQTDPDHNRSVITFAGPPEAVLEAALRGAAQAFDQIDLRIHQGVHPRLGALDVLPFVPLDGVTLEDCVRLAERAGREIWNRHRVPVYFYEAAAHHGGRRNLANIRRGEFEGLTAESLSDPSRRPDIGGPALHPSAGAVAVGARDILIAFNVQLATGDVAVAREIARKIRHSSGGLPHLKAIGVPLPSRKLVQVSMNLTDFNTTGVEAAFAAVEREAARLGVALAGSELVGLIPKKALDLNSGRVPSIGNFSPEQIIENRIETARRRRSRME
jgi:glutamate formiminotransferase/glutamate formiminotransferase/formiminotetrahydrofolate cyclodeaminase